jgi:GAF domain-containing protein
LDVTVLGIALVAFGAGIFLLAHFILRATPQLQPVAQSAFKPTVPLELEEHGEAVLLVLFGGRVAYLNQPARDWFNIIEEGANLENLARRTRPSESFLSLCAAEGQVKFSLDGRLIEGTSYFVPYEGSQALLVSLRRPQRTGELQAASGQLSDQTLFIFNELSQAIASSLDLEATLNTILERVERLIPCDISEITLWEPGLDRFTPYRLVGLPGIDQRLERGADFYASDQGYTGYLVTQRKSLLISDVESFQKTRPAADYQRIPICSFLGMPLFVGEEVIGTLELGSFNKDGFNQNDLEILEIVTSQAAAGLHNALLYRVEHQRVKELTGLASLAQSTSTLSDPKDLFAHLTENLAPLLNVEILGFLIYDENRRMLVSQAPFMGISNKIIEWYKASIQRESPAEQLWESFETIVATKGPEDERLRALGLDHLARAAGILHTALVPLAASGRKLGYLQAANKQDGTPIDHDDLRLLAIVASQVAPIIENSTLIQESRHRAQRAETLRRIASLTGSAATLEEVLKYSLVDLARLIQADVAACLLLDENRDVLRPHIGSLFGFSAEVANRLGHIPINDPQFALTVTGSQRQFVSGNLEEDTRLPAPYRPLTDHLKILSIIEVPLVARDRGIGELLLGSFKPDFFTHGDMLTSATAAGQLAAAIEQASLSSQTDQNLRKRVDQLTSLMHVSRELNSTLDRETLLQRLLDEVMKTTRADCGRVLYFDPDKGSTLAQPQILIHPGEPSPATLEQTEKIVIQDGESLIIDDFDNLKGKPRLRKATCPHAGIRSALVVPIAYQGKMAGLIALHAKTANHFDETAREISEILATQAAIALGYAQRYQDQVRRRELLGQRVETLSRLFETSQALQAEQPLEKSLETIACAIQSATQFNIVLISLYDPATKSLQRMSGAGISPNILAELRLHPQPWDRLMDLLKPEYRLGHCYFIPCEKQSDLPDEIQPVTLSSADNSDKDEKHWHPEDILILPLIGSTGAPLGLVSVDDPRHHLRPDEAALETLEIFGSQAALVIENQRKFQAMHQQVKTIQAELEQMQEAAHATQLQLPALLQKESEQTLDIQRLKGQARRFNAGLEIAELVNRQNSRQDVLAILGREMMERMQMDAVLVAEPGAASGHSPVPRLDYILGDLPIGANPEALLGQRNPLRICLQTGKTLLVANLVDAPEWQNSPLLTALDAKAFICLPVPAQATPDCAALAVSHTPMASFTAEDEQMFNLLSQQVANALQRPLLIDETNRRLKEVNLLLEFSRQLGSLDPASILHALVESALSALPAAQAGMVALWDSRQNLLSPQFASGYPNNARLLEIDFRPGEALPGQAFSQGQPLRTDDIDLAWHYNLPPENLLRYRDATAGRPPVSCMLIPIIGTRETTPLGVLVLDSFTNPAAFSADDQALITSLAQQTALTLENAGLYQASEQRARQLQALTDVAATISSSLQPEDLIT